MKIDRRQPLVPKLRFPEFLEDSEWNYAFVADLINTIIPPKKLLSSAYLPDGCFPIIDQSRSYICGWTNDNDAVITKQLPVIVFGDHTCVLKFVDQPFAQGADGIKIVTANRCVSTAYLYHHLSCIPLVPKQYKRHFSTLKNQIICFPNPKSNEQQKITDCLISLDDLIATEEQKLEALKRHKKGLLQQLFPQPGETMPKLRFPEFLEDSEWNYAFVADLINTIIPPKKLLSSAYLPDGCFPIIDQSRSYICGWTNDNDAVITKQLPVIVFGDHTCVLKFVDQPFAQGADGIKIVTANRCVSTAYLYHHLSCIPLVPKQYKRHFSTLKNQIICFPNPKSNEQQKITDCLISLDDLIATEEQKLEALKRHKKGLLQQMFPSLDKR